MFSISIPLNLPFLQPQRPLPGTLSCFVPEWAPTAWAPTVLQEGERSLEIRWDYSEATPKTGVQGEFIKWGSILKCRRNPQVRDASKLGP